MIGRGAKTVWGVICKPGVEGLHAAARVAASSTAAFVFGQYVLGSSNAGLFGALAPVGLLVFGHVGGSRSQQRRALIVTALISAIFIAVGTLVSEQTALAATTVGICAFSINLIAAAIGHNAAGMSNVIVLFTLASAGIPASMDVTGNRVIGFLIGSVFALLAVSFMWRPPDAADFRHRLASSLQAISKFAAALSVHPFDAKKCQELREAATNAVQASAPFLAPVTERPVGPSAGDRAQIYLVHLGERMLRLLDQSADDLMTANTAEGPLSGPIREVLAEIAETLDCCSDCLNGQDIQPDVDDPRTALRAFIARADAQIQTALVEGAEPDKLILMCDRTVRTRELATSASIVASETRVALGIDRMPTVAEGPSPSGQVARALIRIRTNLSPKSVVMQNSIKLGVGLAIARTVAGVFGLQHGFWVTLATLGTLRTSAGGTRKSIVEVVLGTVAGAIVGTFILIALDNRELATLLLLPIVAGLCAYLSAISLVGSQAGFAILILTIFNLIAPTDLALGIVRIEDVLIGGAVGLIVGLIAWPRGATGMLKRALADAIDAGSEYMRQVVRTLLQAPRDDRYALRTSAFASVRRAEDTLAIALGEGSDTGSLLKANAPILSRARQLWMVADLIGGLSPAKTPASCHILSEALLTVNDKVNYGFMNASAALREGVSCSDDWVGPPRAGHGEPARLCTACARRDGDPADIDGVQFLLLVRSWLTEFAMDLERLRTTINPVSSATPGHDRATGG